MGSRLTDQVNGATTTTNAAPTQIVAYTLPDNSVARVSVTINARKPSDGTSGVWEHRIAAKRHNGGDVVLLGLPIDLLGTQGRDLLAATWGASYHVDGDKILLNVSGAIGATIEWSANMRLEIYKS